MNRKPIRPKPIINSIGFITSLAFLLACIPFSGSAVAQTSPLDGDWITDLGEFNITVEGDQLSGTFGPNGDLTGKVEESGAATIEFKSAKKSGNAKITPDEDGQTFTGKYTTNNSGGTLRGWKLSTEADVEPMDFSGLWLSNWGNMVLEQDGNKVKGKYGSQGLATLSGTVTGRRLDFTWKKLHWSGKAFIEQLPDGSRIFGTQVEEDDPTIWIGVRPTEFQYHNDPKPGEIVKGYSESGMLYHLRMPDEWKPGDPVDVIVLLHGSNFTTAGMVFVTAKNWPDIGKRFAILGIQGERWAKWSDADDLRHNYTYVNWMGRSTYQGYPYTDRESPSLVMELLDELTEEYDFQRRFVGGHSQGGYLSYVLHMHFADKLDGTFPVAGGVIIQAEPDVFDDEALKQAQRSTPMVIVHGKKDGVVAPSMGEYAYNRFLSHDFHNVKFLNPPLGHPYDFLPINDAIEYLDVMSGDDSERLFKFAQKGVAKKRWREVGSAIARAKEIDAGSKFAPIWKIHNAEAKKEAEKYKKLLQEGEYGKWYDRFLNWQEKFATADAAEEVNAALMELRETQAEQAKELVSASREAFNNGDANTGWEKRVELVLDCFATPEYKTYKSGVEKKFGNLVKLQKARMQQEK